MTKTHLPTFDEKLLLLRQKTDETFAAKPGDIRMELLVCGDTGCVLAESLDIIDMLRDGLKDRGIDDVSVVQVGCFGFCSEGPIIRVMPDDVFYVRVKPDDVDEIIDRHVVEGEHIDRLIYVDPQTEKKIEEHNDMPFYKKQLRIALRNCGIVNPESIDEALANGGYKALEKALFEMTPEEVIEEVQESGLRGRGGGGFPTGLKWSLARRSEGETKYIICNADEGDPGAFMDRSILEGDPHTIVEAMTIAGYAIGAGQGIIYCRAEYPIAVHRLELAIKKAKEKGLLGDNILGTDFSFDLSIVLGAGAFVCGEETALIASAEGNRGEPRRKPPYPADKGYMGCPTNVNNVETYANIPEIINKGAAWFNKIGTEKSKGTKVFTLAGKVKNIGLVEVPMGTTLREIIFEIGGGIEDGKRFKAVQTGGPSGGVITEADLDTPIDYESLSAIGSMMGSGGMIVMDEDDDMVEIAKFYLDFTTDESCGKCTPCRIGTTRIQEMLKRLLEQQGDEPDEHILDELDYLCHAVKDSALCALGQTAPNPVLSTMKYFREEYEAYARHEVVKAYSIDAALCIGCTRCAKACPVGCISGELKEPHIIDETQCISCGSCYTVCPVDAVIKP